MNDQVNWNIIKGAFDNSIEGIMVLDDQDRIMMANPALETLYGYKNGELVSKHVDELVPQHIREKHLIHRTASRNDGSNRTFADAMELVGLRKDGSEFPYDLGVNPLTIDGTKFSIISMIDVSERERAKEQLRHTTAKLEEAQKLAHAGSWYWNLKTNERKWSDEFHHICGVSPKEDKITAANVDSFIHPDDREMAMKAVDDAIKNKTPYQFENRILRPDGTIRDVIANGKVVYNNKGEAIEMMGTLQDITERKTQERALEKAKKDLEKYAGDLELKIQQRTQEMVSSLQREQKLNSMKSRFVSMASHEFRTPLSIILSSVGLISKYTLNEQQEQRDRHIQKIKSSVKNLIDIMDEFLSLEKLEQGKTEVDPVAMNLEREIADIVADVGTAHKADGRIKFKYNGKKDVIIDKKMIRNTMMNLLSNAIKYSEKEIDVDVRVADQRINIDVTDRGIGIPEDERKEMFNTFFRARNASRIHGTGLGLNIVKRYLDLMGGEIDFKSELNKGTTFMVTVPEAVVPVEELAPIA